MRKVTCQECGRTYDCDKEDLCPKCGSFNYGSSASGTKLEQDLLSRFEGLRQTAPRYMPGSTGAAVEGRRRHGERIEDCAPKARSSTPGAARQRPDRSRPAGRNKKSPMTAVLIVVAVAVLMNVLPVLLMKLQLLLRLY